PGGVIDARPFPIVRPLWKSLAQRPSRPAADPRDPDVVTLGVGADSIGGERLQAVQCLHRTSEDIGSECGCIGQSIRSLAVVMLRLVKLSAGLRPAAGHEAPASVGFKV